MKISRFFPPLVCLMAGWGIIAPLNPAHATLFSQAEVNQSRIAVIAVPRGEAHQLLIVEQISNSRSCWNEAGNSPITIDPLLVNFDFTGICGRSTDSNGFSIRMANQDYGLQYTLRVVQRGEDVLLLGVNDRDRSELLIGRTQGYAPGFLKIQLEPGWRLTKRVYQGRRLEHFYFTRDTLPVESNTNVAAAPTRNSGRLPARQSPPPSSPALFQVPPPPQRIPLNSLPPTSASNAPGAIEITVPPPETGSSAAPPPLERTFTAPASRSAGVLPVPNPNVPLGSAGTPALPTLPVSRSANGSSAPPPPPTLAATLGFQYRVVVEAENEAEQQRVKSLVPGAFRVRSRGRNLMQAGLFQERTRADELQQRLISNGLRASVESVQ